MTLKSTKNLISFSLYLLVLNLKCVIIRSCESQGLHLGGSIIENVGRAAPA